MKRDRKSTGLRKPSFFIAIGYEEIYDDYTTVNPLDLLDGIPTVAVLRFVAEKGISVPFTPPVGPGYTLRITASLSVTVVLPSLATAVSGATVYLNVIFGSYTFDPFLLKKMIQA